MPISSLIIRTEKNRTKEVADILNNFEEAEISEIHDEDIIIITETKEQIDDKALWEQIEKIPGVVKCDLIYHNFEDSPSQK